MLFGHFAVLFIVALGGGAINSVAGGGGFLVFPALLLTGMAPIQANATNTMALWPGTVASVAAYRRELSRMREHIIPLIVTGMNSIFIYSFSQVLSGWLRKGIGNLTWNFSFLGDLGAACAQYRNR